MRKAHLSGPRDRPAADHRRRRGPVVRSAKRRLAEQARPIPEQARDRVDPRDLERLLPGERRQDRRQSSREHRLPGARRPLEQEVVGPGRGDLERAPAALLPADVGEIDADGHGHDRRRRRAPRTAGGPIGSSPRR